MEQHEKILKFQAAMKMTEGITLFKKRASHLVPYGFGPSKSQIHYFLLWDIRKLAKDIKALPTKQCFNQHKGLACDFEVRKVENTRRRLLPRRKIWKLNKDSVTIPNANKNSAHISTRVLDEKRAHLDTEIHGVEMI